MSDVQDDVPTGGDGLQTAANAQGVSANTAAVAWYQKRGFDEVESARAADAPKPAPPPPEHRKRSVGLGWLSHPLQGVDAQQTEAQSERVGRESAEGQP